MQSAPEISTGNWWPKTVRRICIKMGPEMLQWWTAAIRRRSRDKVNLSICVSNYALRHEGVWGSECIDLRFLDLGTVWNGYKGNVYWEQFRRTQEFMVDDDVILQWRNDLRYYPMMTQYQRWFQTQNTDISFSVDSVTLLSWFHVPELCIDLPPPPSMRSRYSDWLRAGRPRGNYLFSTSSRLALGPTQHHIQRIPGVKRPGREADYSSPTIAEVKKMSILHPLRHMPSWRSA
jgi:hypothetical protein